MSRLKETATDPRCQFCGGWKPHKSWCPIYRGPDAEPEEHYKGNTTCGDLPWGCVVCDPKGKHIDMREWSDDLLMGGAPH